MVLFADCSGWLDLAAFRLSPRNAHAGRPWGLIGRFRQARLKSRNSAKANKNRAVSLPPNRERADQAAAPAKQAKSSGGNGEALLLAGLRPSRSFDEATS
jgi:hypothetical protein